MFPGEGAVSRRAHATASVPFGARQGPIRTLHQDGQLLWLTGPCRHADRNRETDRLPAGLEFGNRVFRVLLFGLHRTIINRRPQWRLATNKVKTPQAIRMPPKRLAGSRCVSRKKTRANSATKNG